MKELSELDIEVLTEYDKVLIGKQRIIDPYYFHRSKTPEARQHTALTLIQYACEVYLRWSPQKMYESISMDILKQWKLTGYLTHIEFPPELNKERNLWYLAHMIYPDVIHVSDKEICLSVYRQVLSGEIKKFPKKFFSDSRNMKRACVCLKYAIDNYTNFNNVEALYDFFGSSECLKFLSTYRLDMYIRNIFDSPITALYLIVPPDQDLPFLFHYYRFWQIFEDERRRELEVRGKKAVHPHAAINEEDRKYVQIDF